MLTIGADAPHPGTGQLVRVGTFISEDPWIQEQATAPWDIAVTPLSRGDYRHELVCLASAGLILYRERYWTRTRIQGLSPPGMFGFGVPLHVGRGTGWWGAPLHEQGLPTAMPGGMHVELAPNQQHLVALIDLGLLRDSLPHDLGVAVERAACRHLLTASRSAVARLGKALNALLDGAQANPQALCHPNAVQAMGQDLLAALRQSLTLPLPTPRRVGRAVRQRGLQKALEFLRATDPGSVTVADLCTAACVTERTLQYAFRESLGSSPLEFLHLRRFHAARRELLAANYQTTMVNEIAQRNGFYDMGRFAVRYKARFGQSPSDTLMMQPKASQSHLRL